MSKNKVLVAMSGGVDSTVAALLLKDKYDMIGITMQLWSNENEVPEGDGVPYDQNSLDAKEIADALSFPHMSVALGESFKESVIRPFISEYRKGNTPNPCVECNKKLKFGKLFEIADRLGIEYLATGHYARIEKDESGHFHLMRATDSAKDQSYFLWGIQKEKLSRIIFPLGEMSKPEIRELAASNGFNSASRSDSQDICFIPDGDYISFIEKNDGPISKKGDFVDTDGKVLGTHEGLERYTIGQRKGLGIAFGIPMFVGQKDVKSNTVTLCSDPELYKTELVAHSLNILEDISFDTPKRLFAKIRYRHTPAIATVEAIEGGRLRVRFDLPQRAIAPGQSLVLYDGDTVVGGGIIE